MSLIFINLSAVVGGQEIYLSEIIPLLHYNGRKILITPEITASHHVFHDLKETEVVTVPSCGYKDFLHIKKIITMTASKGDILVFNGNRAIYCGFLINDKYKKYAIQHSSLLYSQDMILKKYIRTFIYSRFILKRYRALIGVSEHSVRPISSEKNVFIVYNGIDLEKFKPSNSKTKNSLRKRMHLTENDVVILMVGSLNKNKGQMKAVKIMEHLPEKFKLVLAGIGPDMEKIRQAAFEARMIKRIHITGHIEDMRNIYAAADMLLFLSSDEGLPLAILEAMASGLPIITTQAGAIPDILNEKQNCLFITRDNPAESAKKIKFLWENNTLRITMQKDNRKLVKNKFNLKNNTKKLLSIITESSI